MAATLLAAAAGCVPAKPSPRAVHDLAARRWRGETQTSPADDKTVQQLLSKPLTADSAAQIAVLTNPSVAVAFEEMGAARAAVAHALRLPNPVAEGALRFTDGSPEIDLGASVDLTELLFLPWRDGVGQAELEAAKMSVVGAIVDLAFDARLAFFEYLAAAQALELRRSVGDALQASLEAATRLHDAGNITDLELANERALYEEAQLALSHAQTGLTTAREELGLLLGVRRGVRWTPPAAKRLPEPARNDIAIESLERQAVENSIDLALARQRSSAADDRASLARAEGWFPELKAGVSAERDEGDWSIGPAAEVEVPLFYQGQGEVDGALAEKRRQDRVQDSLTAHIRASARAAWARLVAARSNVLHYREVVLPLRQHIVEQTQLEYNAMGASVFQLLQAKRDQIESGGTYVEILRDYWLARTEAQRLMAGKLGRSGLGALTANELGP